MSRLDALTKSLVDIYANKLSAGEQEELMQALDVLANDQKYNKFNNFFPDTGEFRRELYPKHIAFFNAGKDYLERAFIAGNRVGKCLSYRTLIELADGSKEQAGVLYECKEPFDVLSWDGEQVVTATVTDWVKKEPETVYRVWLENGEWFECAANHRVLCQDGSWSFVGRLLECAPILPLTILDSDPSTQRLDVLRYLGTLRDSQCGCPDDSHSYDGQPLSATETFEACVPSQGDVQQRSAALSQMDDLGNTGIHTHQRLCAHLSTLDADHRALGQSSFSQPHTPSAAVRSQTLNTKNGQQSLGLFYRDVQPILEVLSGQYEFSSLKSPFNIDGNRIIGYNIVGVNDIYDFTVPRFHNYISHGIVHHNTEAGAYETVCHCTGLYPDWWEGRRFNRPILAWVGGDTATTVRDIIQKKLLGDINDIGSGMLPKDTIIEYKSRRNVPDAIETIRIKHVTGGVSTLVLKTYEQGRATWQGTEVDLIWVDEECPQAVYGEALIRLMTTQGSILTTFTPLNGLTELVLGFLDNSQDTDAEFPKYVQVVAWSDVPHITEEMKKKMLDATPPQLREARAQGIPTVGEGLVYPVDPKYIVVDDFKIPLHYKKLYGMDVGWNNTAAVWGAWDIDNDVIYVYSEHKQGQAEPLIHAQAIKARGEWIRGEIDPAARGRSQIDGESLFNLYRSAGLKIYPADNSVEAGIFKVWERLTTGRLKIFSSCSGVLRELSLYHRDDKGKIVKKNDHLLDALRYMINAEPNAWSYPKRQNDRQKLIKMQNYMNACT